VVINPSTIPYLSLITCYQLNSGWGYLCEGSETVGCATGVADDIVFGLVSVKIDSTDKHGCVGRGSRDDDLLGSSFKMGCCLVFGGEDTSRLDDVLSLAMH
jgi:hypothetical protein